MRFKYNLIIGIGAFVSAYTLNFVNSQTSTGVCVNDEEPVNKLQALHAAFPQSKSQIDFIIVIDRSQSINQQVYDDTLEAIQNLFDYLITNRRLYIQANYARVALLTFGRTVTFEFEGITDDSRTFDACEVQRRLDALAAQSSQEDSSQITEALQRASSIFSVRQSEGIRKILWVFNDGDVSNDFVEDLTVVESMSATGIIIFSSAVGKEPKGWLNSIEKENRVKSYAKDVDHFACVETWIQLFAENIQNVSQVLDDGKVFSGVTLEPQLLPDNCAACPSNTDNLFCSCDVIGREYVCKECSLIEECSSTGEDTSRVTSSTTSNPTRRTTTQTQVSENETILPLWLLITIIVAATMVVLSCLCIVFVFLYRSSGGSKRKDSSPIAPPLPLPPRKATNRQELHIMSHDPIYVNRASLTAKTKSGSETDCEDAYISLGRNSVLEEISDEKDTNMEGWGSFLQKEATENKLKHLGIFSLDQKRESAAWTKGFRISHNQLRNLDKAMSHGSVYDKKGTIRIKEKSFLVDKENLTPLNMRALRKSTRRVHSRKTSLDNLEEMHVCKSGNYLVVGVASAENGDICQQTVVELRRYLENNTDNDEENTSAAANNV